MNHATTTAPAPVDAYDLRSIQETARALAAKFDLDYWRRHDTEGKYPWEFIDTFAAAGWRGAMIPEEYGGMGVGLTAASALHFSIISARPGHPPRFGGHEAKIPA